MSNWISLTLKNSTDNKYFHYRVETDWDIFLDKNIFSENSYNLIKYIHPYIQKYYDNQPITIYRIVPTEELFNFRIIFVKEKNLHICKASIKLNSNDNTVMLRPEDYDNYKISFLDEFYQLKSNTYMNEEIKIKMSQIDAIYDSVIKKHTNNLLLLKTIHNKNNTLYEDYINKIYEHQNHTITILEGKWKHIKNKIESFYFSYSIYLKLQNDNILLIKKKIHDVLFETANYCYVEINSFTKDRIKLQKRKQKFNDVFDKFASINEKNKIVFQNIELENIFQFAADIEKSIKNANTGELKSKTLKKIASTKLRIELEKIDDKLFYIINKPTSFNDDKWRCEVNKEINLLNSLSNPNQYSIADFLKNDITLIEYEMNAYNNELNKTTKNITIVMDIINYTDKFLQLKKNYETFLRGIEHDIAGSNNNSLQENINQIKKIISINEMIIINIDYKELTEANQPMLDKLNDNNKKIQDIIKLASKESQDIAQQTSLEKLKSNQPAIEIKNQSYKKYLFLTHYDTHSFILTAESEHGSMPYSYTLIKLSNIFIDILANFEFWQNQVGIFGGGKNISRSDYQLDQNIKLPVGIADIINDKNILLNRHITDSEGAKNLLVTIKKYVSNRIDQHSQSIWCCFYAWKTETTGLFYNLVNTLDSNQLANEIYLSSYILKLENFKKLLPENIRVSSLISISTDALPR